jgi:hypothetical protein
MHISNRALNIVYDGLWAVELAIPLLLALEMIDGVCD